MKQKILLVEDDEMIASGLLYALKQEGYIAIRAKNVEKALSLIKTESFDLALLDMQLPDGLGTQVHEKLKKTLVIYLTIVDDEGNIVRAFENGAADYVTKPFRLRELLARVRRTLNSSDGNNVTNLTLGNVNIDYIAGKAYLGDTILDLTALEYKLLLTFAQHKGQLLSRSQILENIWDASGNFVEDNTLTVYIKRLREKLGNAVNIETIRGRGYRVD